MSVRNKTKRTRNGRKCQVQFNQKASVDIVFSSDQIMNIPVTKRFKPLIDLDLIGVVDIINSIWIKLFIEIRTKKRKLHEKYQLLNTKWSKDEYFICVWIKSSVGWHLRRKHVWFYCAFSQLKQSMYWIKCCSCIWLILIGVCSSHKCYFLYGFHHNLSALKMCYKMNWIITY